MKTILIFFLFGVFSTAWPHEKILEIKFSNLNRTHPDYLKQFVQTTVGANLDSALLQTDLQNLRNLKLFSDVSYAIADSTNGKVVTFHFEELVTVLPISNFGGIKNNFWFQLGLNNFNWLGRGNTLGGYYRYYDRHSFEGYLKIPYLAGSRWGLTVAANKLSTIEPTKIDGQYVSYNADRWTFTALARYSFSNHIWWEMGGGYLYERYEKNLERSSADAPGPQLEKFNKYLLKTIGTWDHINYFFQYLSGFSTELNLESVITQGESDPFWKVQSISKGYARLGKRGNLAFRLRTGISRNDNSPFVPFVLDSYITVRGSGNRVSRGTAEFTVNAEHRHTLLQRKWGAVQGVAFIDWSAWRPAGGDFSDMFKTENNVTFAGVGFRVYFRKIYNLVLRIDYGMSLVDRDQHGVVFGTGHYF